MRISDWSSDVCSSDLFLLRPCSDSIFASRTRPCLQYQIKRCSAPCVGRIAESDYRELVNEARDFLTGKSRDIQERLASQMQAASEALDFETAARYRDRIRALTEIQAHQSITWPASTKRMSSPFTRPAGRPASRCSSSAPA